MPGTPDVRLRPVRPEDATAHFEQQADPESAAMAAVPMRDRAGFDAHRAISMRDPDNVLLSVVVDDEVVGSAMSFRRDGARHVGYRIAREHWGKGIATAALGLLLEELAERPLIATVAEHNVASLRVLEKHGFRRVGEEQADDVRLIVFELP